MGEAYKLTGIGKNHKTGCVDYMRMVQELELKMKLLDQT